jgi:hypothetical protein
VENAEEVGGEAQKSARIGGVRVLALNGSACCRALKNHHLGSIRAFYPAVMRLKKQIFSIFRNFTLVKSLRAG